MNKVPDNVAKHVSQVHTSLPSFIIEDHPKFVEFLKAYYRWSSTEGPAAALNYMKVNNDVDFVLDSMLDGYANLYAYNIPREMKADYRFFLKFLSEFYEIKGSEESYKILYRALFDEEVLVYFPKRNLLIPSAATWAKDKTFRVKYTGDAWNLRGKTLKGEAHGYKCMVSDVIRNGDIVTIYFQNSTGLFEPNEKLSILETDEYLNVLPVYAVGSITSDPVFRDEDIIKVSHDLILKVDKINYGHIVSIAQTDGGQGFKVGDVITTKSNHSGTGFRADVSSVDANGAVTGFVVLRSGFGYVNEDVEFVAFTGNGTGFKADITWNPEFRTIHTASVILNKEKTTPGDVVIPFTGGSVTFTDGAYTVPRYWKVIRGAPSTETARIHDSDYYQEFSYVLSSAANTVGSEPAIKKALQIAGLKMFIEQNVSKTIEASFETEISFS